LEVADQRLVDLCRDFVAVRVNHIGTRLLFAEVYDFLPLNFAHQHRFDGWQRFQLPLRGATSCNILQAEADKSVLRLIGGLQSKVGQFQNFHSLWLRIAVIEQKMEYFRVVGSFKILEEGFDEESEIFAKVLVYLVERFDD
jgi:hypothetical protein